MARADAFTSPFAPLTLTPADEAMLDELSRVILHNYVAQYEAFERENMITSRNGERVVDERIWKPVRKEDNVHTYVQRKDRDDGGRAKLTRSVEQYSTVGAVAPPDFPVMLVLGSIPGTLDDIMYGLMGPNMDAARVRTSYVNDQMLDGAVLATLLEPTPDEPLSSLLIRWIHSKAAHGVLRTVVSDRDYIYMERTGIAFTASGERIGFHVLHSVNFPQTHELPGLVRGNGSVCGIYRHNAERNHVELYVRTIADARGHTPRPLVVYASADVFISVAQYMESAYRKKLVWHLRKRRKAVTAAVTTVTALESDVCVICSKPPSKAAELLRGDHTRRRTCALCLKPICKSCRIKKRLSEVVASALEQRTFAFCCACYSDVCRASALDIARDEASGRSTDEDMRLWSWSECPSAMSSE